MRKISLALMCTALMLAGCANSATSLGRVAPKSNVVAAHAGTANYDAVDKYSFAQAEVLYPASNGHHRIAVGDFLLSEVFEVLRSRSVKLVRLLAFSAQCDSSGVFMPHVLCNVEYTMEIDDPPKRTVQGKLRSIDIGNMVVRQDQFFLLPVVVSDEFFQKQLSPLLQAISADFREKIPPSPSR